MLENVRVLLIAASVACWVLAAIFTGLMIRTKVRPSIRQAFRWVAWLHTGSVAVIITRHAWLAAHTGVILPMWFYACIWIGILIPWVIAFHVASVDREKR